MISVAGLLRPLKEKNVDALEELAARIAGGETVAPGEVQAVLDRARQSEADLQRAVDRHARVAGLRAEAAAGEPFRRKLAAVEAEVNAAYAELGKAQRVYDAMLAKHGEDLLNLRARVDAADRAASELTSYENLPPSTAGRLRAVRDAAANAEQNVTGAQLALSRARKQLVEAEEAFTEAKGAAKAHPAIEGLKVKADRLRVAVDTRRKLVAEAEEALRAAEAALVAAQRERNAVQLEVGQAAGAT